MSGRASTIAVMDLRGGINSGDDPFVVPADQCVSASNVDWSAGTFAHKRNGSSTLSLSGGTAFSSFVKTILRHVPGADETAAELWGFDGAATPIVKRLTGGTTWANVTVDDAWTQADVISINGASFNGKLFLAGNTAQDRLHCYDPGLSSPRVRRVGLATPTAAPTAADSTAGAYPAILRYYRVRWVQQTASGGIVRRSEPSAAVTFTPDGGHGAVQITQPTVANEGETHWEIEVSLDNTTWYVIYGPGATTTPAIATTSVLDVTATTSYNINPLADPAGFYGAFPSVKYLVTDGNRLLGAGAWETSGANSGGKSSRVWFTPVLGSADKGDDERVPQTTTQKNWVDLNENDGGPITALGGPFDGRIWAFKRRQIWRLTPTGDVAAPYLTKKLIDGVGCISHKSLAVGEDEAGQPCLYFQSANGPYRLGASGLQFLGRDLIDRWPTLIAAGPAQSVWYPEKRQWWLTAWGGASPVEIAVFDVQFGRADEGNSVRRGWTKHAGPVLAAGGVGSLCLFSRVPGASMSLDLRPYVSDGQTTAVYMFDDASVTQDSGTPFQATVTTRPLQVASDLARTVGVREPLLVATASSGVTITVTLKSHLSEARSGTAVLTLISGETGTPVIRKIEGGAIAEAVWVQATVGDAAAVSNAWTLTALVVPLHDEGPR